MSSKHETDDENGISCIRRVEFMCGTPRVLKTSQRTHKSKFALISAYWPSDSGSNKSQLWMRRSLRQFELCSSTAYGYYCPWRVDSISGIRFRLSAHFRLTFQCWKLESNCSSDEPAEHLNIPPTIPNSTVGKSFFPRMQNWYHLLKTDSRKWNRWWKRNLLYS